MAERQAGVRVPGLDRALFNMVDALVGRHIHRYWHHAHHHWRHHHHHHSWVYDWHPWARHHHHRHHQAHHHHRHRFLASLAAGNMRPTTGKDPSKTDGSKTDPSKTDSTTTAIVKKAKTGKSDSVLGLVGAGVGQNKKPGRTGQKGGKNALANPSKPGSGVGGLSRPNRPQTVSTARPTSAKPTTAPRLRQASTANLFASARMHRAQSQFVGRAKGAGGFHHLSAPSLKAGYARKR